MHDERLTASELVRILGGHPASALGLDLDADHDADVGAWLVASVLLGGRTKEPIALAAFERLRDAGLATPAAIAAAGANGVFEHLQGAKVPKSEAVAAVVARVCTSLERDWEGSVDRLAASADALEELAGRLSALGAGFGRSGVLRFLVPLRDRWSTANDLPGSAAVACAAADLGVIPDRDDAESAPSSIARWVRNEADAASVPAAAPPARDVEAALERLGRTACVRERRDRCPLGAQCPASAPAE